ncbi:calponin homology domain-containing protein DDB_G0272472-like isoform X1 [Anneissia japonica]|uniref:calponin homology domain-containing protein DDB_G0272472-like isoform X1 n=1 Tax=Anneissia japonica TaxID=1529436 RepID=UPI001425B461|nr:calponin homology domain-containing protein DDB_G0272472-like isoform X1 [Anneissia japonica]
MKPLLLYLEERLITPNSHKSPTATSLDSVVLIVIDQGTNWYCDYLYHDKKSMFTEVADTNDRIQTTPELVHLIRDNKSLAADDIYVSEDVASGVYIISSRAPSIANDCEDESPIGSRMPHSLCNPVPSHKDLSNDNSAGDSVLSIVTDRANVGIPVENTENSKEGSTEYNAKSEVKSAVNEPEKNYGKPNNKMNVDLNKNEENKEDHVVNGSGDTATVKSTRNVAAKHSASTRSLVSEKTSTQATSLEFDVTSYRANKKEEPKVNTVVKEERKSASVNEVDDDTKEFQEAIDKIVKETGLLEKDKKTQKQKKTKKQRPKSPPSVKSDQNEQLDERERFIVGKPKEQKKPEEPIPKKTKTKKVVKKEKKKVEKKTKSKKKMPSEQDKITDEPEEKEIALSAKEVEEVKEATIEGLENEDDASKKVAPSSPDVMSVDRSVSEKSSETPESPQFIIIHDEFSDSESDERTSNSEVKSMTPLDDSYSEVMSSVMSSVTEDSTSQGPQSISRSQAKQAKRAAEAERRKQEVERKRKERDEAKRKSLEEAERREQLKREFEEERRRKEEEIRQRREREIEEKRKKEEAALEKKRQAELALERERKQREERQRKMNEMARKKREEELRKKEEAEKERKEEEERRKAEEEMLAAMAEEERLEYEKRKQEEELLQKELAEKERLRREEEARIAQEEAERLMLLKLKEQKELEARLQFNRLLQSESNIMAHSQEMTRAFTFSYYELLEALGIDPPEWLKKELEEYT